MSAPRVAGRAGPGRTARSGRTASLAAWAALAAMPAGFVAVLYAWPLAAVIERGLRAGGELSLRPVGDVLTDGGLRHVVWFTLGQAALSTLATLVIALPAAHVLARYEFPGRRTVRALTTVPFVLPTVVVGAAFVALGDRLGLGSGPFAVRGSLWGIVAAHVLLNAGVVVRTVGGMWEHVDPRTEDAARVLGAGRLRVLREVTLPLVAPALLAASSIVFLFTFASFGVILVLGGPTRATVETEIYRQAVVRTDLQAAAALSVVQLIAAAALAAVYARAQRRRAVAQRLRPGTEVRRRPRTPGERLTVAGALALLAVVIGLPLVALVDRSLRVGDRYGLAGWRALVDPPTPSVLPVAPWEAVRTSVTVAAVAALIALAVALPASLVIVHGPRPLARVFDGGLVLPLGTSAVTLGLGILLALDRPPLDLRTSRALLPLAHALVGIPLVVRAVVPVLRSVEPRLREAAAVLGAPPWRAWREIDLPFAARGLAVGASFAFAVSLGEFGATSFLVRPSTTTMPVAIARLLGRPGAVTGAEGMAMATVLMLVTAAAVLAIERLRPAAAEL